ncbi:GPP34 family phosphoprotein [uncultured Modestobacter sp.]|uniref:GPP34 family phosphoprotein n=1 Tax=uncultured Modestobacter sp. TaxID=380048 RepID=UPI002614CFEB|nr:GPP34 family phosphoprotein [uncultured Modestobacter sp.]
MTRSGSTIDRLGVPGALMPLLHTSAGQPYQRFQPPKVAAAAELLELTVRGDVQVVDGAVVAARATTDGPAWRDEVSADLARRCSGGGAVRLATWLRLRRGALAVQQAAAVTAGALRPGRGRLLGLIPYRTRVPDAAVRAAVIAELTERSGSPSARVAALAGLVHGAKIEAVLDLDAHRRAALADAAADAPAGGPGDQVAASVQAANAALATVLYLQLAGD